MADGQILIDTRIRTDEVKQDTANLKNQLESLAESASASAKKIDRSFDSLTIDDAAEGLGDSFEQEARKIDPIPEEIERDFEGMGLENAADGLADGFEEEAEKIEDIPDKIEESFEDIDLDNTADGLAESFDEAWDDVRRSSSRGADHVKDELDDIGDEASSVGDKIKSKLKDAFDNISGSLGEGFAGGLFAGISEGLTEFALDAVEDIAGELVEFGKQSIELASNLQEVQNVVDVTFGSMSDAVNDFAKDALKTAGLSETMAKQYVGTFGAMAKSFGFTEAEAYKMSTALTQLAGDIASFYNISQDDAYSKLTAVFTGETEALKQLGVVMTETALNAYAMEKGLGKTTQQMSEQEKAALRYQFVLDKLSDASGDFVRTQDSWANQTKILSEQWNRFSAEVGEGLISMLTPGITYLTGTFMPALINLGKGFGAVGKAIGAVFEIIMVPAKAIGPLITYLWDVLGNMYEMIGDAYDWLREKIADAFSTEPMENMKSKLVETATEMWLQTGNMNDALGDTEAQMEEVSAASYNALDLLQGIPLKEAAISAATSEVAASVALLREEYDAARVAALDSINSQIGLFDALNVESKMSATEAVANWGSQVEALKNYQSNLQRAVQLGFATELLAQLSDGSTESMAMLNELVNSTEVNVQEINAAFEEVQQAKETVASTMAAIQTDTIAKLEELAGETANKWGEMAGDVGSAISEMQAYINSLQGKDVYVNVITRQLDGPGVNRGGSSGSSSGGAVDFNSVYSTRSIPYLASGAVIPPNAPFTAVLGDQRNGTNLEAPEGLIRSIFREELADMIGGMSAGFDATVAELQATRAAIEDIQIGDTTIGRAAARYDRRQNLIRGGSTG